MSRPAISYPIPSDEPPPLGLNIGSGSYQIHNAPPYPNLPQHSPLAHTNSLPHPPHSPAHAHHGSLFQLQSQREVSGSGSTAGGSGSSSGPRQVSGPRGPTSTLDSYITRLLVVTKQLLQGLEQWSQRLLSEEAVSDIYVRLGNGFELCVSTFRRAGISTADLDSVPNDLREILERALAEEPSQDTLNIYLPDIRAIIFNLLNGLKNKQIAYKRQIGDRQQPLEPLPPPVPAMPTPTPARPQPRQQSGDAEVRSVRSITSEGPTSPASTKGSLPASRPPATVLAERSQHRSARPAPPDAFQPSRSRPLDGAAGPRTLSSGSMDGRAGHPRATSPIPSVHSAHSVHSMQGTPPMAPAPAPSRQPRRPERTSRDSANVTSRFSADSDVSALSSQRPLSDSAMPMPIPIPHPHQQQHHTPLPLLPNAGPSNMQQQTPSPQPASAPAPAATPPPPPPLPLPAPVTPPPTSSAAMPGLPTLNLPDQGEQPEILNGVTPPLISDDVHPTARSSFALLQRSEALERRASKRFSSYTFSKMVGTSPSGKKTSSSGTGSPPRPARRSNHAVPPMPSLLEANAGRSRGMSISQDGSADSTPSIGMSGELSPVLGQSLDTRRGSGSDPVPTVSSFQSSPLPSLVPAMPKSVTAFLQLGRHVKKTTVELPLTMSSLRLLFMERFEYDPGMEDFPDVYIKDPKTGVQYELEDMDDVKDSCMLCLDIEPLDQVKQHFDLTFASLAQDIKELKTSLSQAKRMSVSTPVAPSLLGISPVLPAAVSPVLPPAPVTPEPARPPTQRTASGRVTPAAELRVHYDEVQSLRRDVAILRQLHVDFLSQTKESFVALRAQNNSMRDVVKTKMGGNRALLDNSKAKLEGQCQDTIQAVEEVSDIIDGAREDALRRGITPPRGGMEKIRADLERATALVDDFSSNVTLAEPTWRATWMSELQRVTEEQRLLAYQNKLAADLKNDIKDATDMLDNVRAFVDQRAAAGGRKFRPPPPPEDTGGGIGNLLLEIRTKEADPNQRLRAIEERAKARERDLANRTDDFQDELGAFVQGKKLRKTGGTDEAERVRQRRQDQTIRRMMSGDGPGEQLSPQLTGASVGRGG